MKRSGGRSSWLPASHSLRAAVPCVLAASLAAVVIAAGSLKPARVHANPAKIWVINNNVAQALKGSPINWTALGLTSSDISSFDAWQTASDGQISSAPAVAGTVYIVVETDGSMTPVSLNGRGLTCSVVVGGTAGTVCDGVATSAPVSVAGSGQFVIWQVNSASTFAGNATVAATQDGVLVESNTLTLVGQANNISLTASKTTIQEGSTGCAIAANQTSPTNGLATAIYTDVNGHPLVGYAPTFASSSYSTFGVGTGWGTAGASQQVTTMLQPDGVTVDGVDSYCGVASGPAILSATTGTSEIVGVIGAVTRTQAITVTGVPASIELTASPALITCDGAHTSTVTATVRDAASNLVVDNTPVNFSVVALGTANPINTLTAGGMASTTVTPFPGAVGVTVVVTSGSAQTSIGVLCAAPPPPAVPHASSGGTSTTLEATLAGAQANTVYRIDLFSSAACSGSVSGGTFIGAFSTSSDGTGNIKFTEILSTDVPAGEVIQATVTDPYNYTSPVSACQRVVARSCPDDTTCNGYTDAQKIALGKDPFTYCGIMRADVNMDGKVSLADLADVAQYFNQSIPPAPARYDQNADGKISLADLALMSSVFNQNVSACP